MTQTKGCETVSSNLDMKEPAMYNSKAAKICSKNEDEHKEKPREFANSAPALKAMTVKVVQAKEKAIRAAAEVQKWRPSNTKGKYLRNCTGYPFSSWGFQIGMTVKCKHFHVVWWSLNVHI